MSGTGKRIAISLVFGVLSLSLVACGSSDSSSNEDKSSSDANRTTPTPAPSVSQAPTEPKKPHGDGTDPGQGEDEPFVQVPSLPKSFPRSLPLPKGGTAIAGTSTLEGWTVEFKGVSAASHRTLRKAIAADGGIQTYATEKGDIRHSQHETSKYTVQLMWMPQARGNETSLVYTVTKKSN